jgi:hypothetical protein
MSAEGYTGDGSQAARARLYAGRIPDSFATMPVVSAHPSDVRAVPMDLKGGIVGVDLVEHDLVLVILRSQHVEPNRAGLILEAAISVGH